MYRGIYRLSLELTGRMAGKFTLLAKEEGFVLPRTVQILSIGFHREEELQALSTLSRRDVQTVLAGHADKYFHQDWSVESHTSNLP